MYPTISMAILQSRNSLYELYFSIKFDLSIILPYIYYFESGILMRMYIEFHPELYWLNFCDQCVKVDTLSFRHSEFPVTDRTVQFTMVTFLDCFVQKSIKSCQMTMSHVKKNQNIAVCTIKVCRALETLFYASQTCE